MAAGNEHVAIAGVFKSYEEALNRSDLSLVRSLYTQDGVCMFPQSAPHVGIEAVVKAYAELFEQVDHIIGIKVEEINPISEEWAFARSICTGRTRLRSTGELRSDAVQTLFVLKKDDGSWRFARYAFSPIGGHGA